MLGVCPEGPTLDKGMLTSFRISDRLVCSAFLSNPGAVMISLISRRRTVVVAAALLTTSSIVASQPATAESTEQGGAVLAATSRVVVRQDGDWVRWDFAEPLSDDVEVFTTRGQRGVDGHCRYTGEGSSDGSQRNVLIVEREVAQNLNRCLMVSERATLTEEDAFKRGFLDEAPAGMETDTAGDNQTALTLETHYAKDGYLKTNYEDPPQIDVTSVTANVSWSTSGGSVTGSHRVANWGWYSPSGWGRHGSWWGGSSNSSFAWTSVYGLYKNGIFCLTIDTWNDYDTTNFRGFGNGSSDWWWASDKWGGCTGLLHHETHVDPN